MKHWVKYPYLVSYLKNGETMYSPVLNIKLISGSINFSTDAIIDSGSDCTLMNASIAKVLGIDSSKCEKDPSIKGLFGDGVEGFMADVKIEVEQFEHEPPLNIKVTFVPGLNTGILLGRDDFFNHFDVLFENRKRIFQLSSD